MSQPVIFLLRRGFLDELDFWVGSFGLVLFALMEAVLFAWVFGMDKGWVEITKGATIPVPRLFYYVIKYVTPLFLLLILVAWAIQDVPSKIFMVGVNPDDVPYLWGARLMMLAILVGFGLLVSVAARRKGEGGTP
jgi:hypothetical protein